MSSLKSISPSRELLILILSILTLSIIYGAKNIMPEAKAFIQRDTLLPRTTIQAKESTPETAKNSLTALSVPIFKVIPITTLTLSHSSLLSVSSTPLKESMSALIRKPKAL